MTAMGKLGVAALIACAAMGSARAAVPDPWGFYVGAQVGMTDFNAFGARLDDLLGVPAAASSVDSTHHGYSLVVGFRFSEYLAVEGSWLDLGRARYRLNNGDADMQLGSRGGVLAVIGSVPLNRTWSLDGHVGMYFSHSSPRGWLSLDLEIDSDGIRIVDLEGRGGADPAGVLGASLVGSFGRYWSARVGYEYVTDRAIDIRNAVADERLDIGAGRWLIGLQYRF
jgi:hypothetical protein